MKIVFCLLLVLIISGCSVTTQLSYFPESLNDQIEISSTVHEGIDSSKFIELISKIYSGEFRGIHSVLISRNNKLVFEKYFAGWNADKPHDLYSAGKSISSVIFGLAVDRKLISPSTKLLKLFEPYCTIVNNETKYKREIQLKHLLSMSSGMACGKFGDIHSDISLIMRKSLNPVRTFLDIPMECEPGKTFLYNDALAEVVNYSLSIVTKNNLNRFQDSLFFSPLGINIKKTEIGLTSRDFLKIGLLFLNKGIWYGRRILSEEWINESTLFKIKPRCQDWFAYGYAYFWWLKKFDYKGKTVECIMAIGNGHQALYIIPELQLVVVFTGENFKSDITWEQPHGIVQDYVINSIVD